VDAYAVRILHESMRGIDELVGNAHSQGSCSLSLCLKAWRLWQGVRVEEVLRREDKKNEEQRTKDRNNARAGGLGNAHINLM
jgi:hypothetical protein